MRAISLLVHAPGFASVYQGFRLVDSIHAYASTPLAGPPLARLPAWSGYR